MKTRFTRNVTALMAVMARTKRNTSAATMAGHSSGTMMRRMVE